MAGRSAIAAQTLTKLALLGDPRGNRDFDHPPFMARQSRGPGRAHCRVAIGLGRDLRRRDCQGHTASAEGAEERLLIAFMLWPQPPIGVRVGRPSQARVTNRSPTTSPRGASRSPSSSARSGTRNQTLRHAALWHLVGDTCDVRKHQKSEFARASWVWRLSMAWIAAGAVVTGYLFYVTLGTASSADIDGIMLIGYSAGPAAVQIAAILAMVVWLALPLPVGIAGLIRLRAWRPTNWLRAAAWVGAWIAGATLCGEARAIPDSAGASWVELSICAAWLALGTVMTRVLAVLAKPRSADVNPALAAEPAVR
jgi:hypothetical protein